MLEKNEGSRGWEEGRRGWEERTMLEIMMKFFGGMQRCGGVAPGANRDDGQFRKKASKKSRAEMQKKREGQVAKISREEMVPWL
jgi:hypothetical protein